MGTKSNPGAFDCYANAAPDEPMFILLGRDEQAPMLVERWARDREAAGEDPAKVDEARGCAAAMRDFRCQREMAKRGLVANPGKIIAFTLEDGTQQTPVCGDCGERICWAPKSGFGQQGEWRHLAPPVVDNLDGHVARPKVFIT